MYPASLRLHRAWQGQGEVDERAVEQAVAEEKARVKEFKRKNEDLMSAIAQLAQDLEQNFDPCREAMGRLATLVEEIKSMRAEVMKYRQTKACVSGTMANIALCSSGQVMKYRQIKACVSGTMANNEV